MNNVPSHITTILGP